MQFKNAKSTPRKNTMKLARSLALALGLRRHRRDRLRADLSGSADHAGRPLSRRRRQRRARAAGRRADEQGARRHHHRREPRRRRRHHRDAPGREERARRLHHPDRDLVARHQPGALSQCRLRPDQGFRADRPAGVGRQRGAGASLGAGELDPGADRARQEGPRQAQLRLDRLRLERASRGRAVRRHGRHQDQPRALSRQRPGAERSARRPRHHDVRDACRRRSAS